MVYFLDLAYILVARSSDGQRSLGVFQSCTIVWNPVVQRYGDWSQICDPCGSKFSGACLGLQPE